MLQLASPELELWSVERCALPPTHQLLSAPLHSTFSHLQSNHLAASTDIFWFVGLGFRLIRQFLLQSNCKLHCCFNYLTFMYLVWFCCIPSTILTLPTKAQLDSPTSLDLVWFGLACVALSAPIFDLLPFAGEQPQWVADPSHVFFPPFSLSTGST